MFEAGKKLIEGDVFWTSRLLLLGSGGIALFDIREMNAVRWWLLMKAKVEYEKRLLEYLGIVWKGRLMLPLGGFINPELWSEMIKEVESEEEVEKAVSDEEIEKMLSDREAWEAEFSIEGLDESEINKKLLEEELEKLGLSFWEDVDKEEVEGEEKESGGES